MRSCPKGAMSGWLKTLDGIAPPTGRQIVGSSVGIRGPFYQGANRRDPRSPPTFEVDERLSPG